MVRQIIRQGQAQTRLPRRHRRHVLLEVHPGRLHRGWGDLHVRHVGREARWGRSQRPLRLCEGRGCHVLQTGGRLNHRLTRGVAPRCWLGSCLDGRKRQALPEAGLDARILEANVVGAPRSSGLGSNAPHSRPLAPALQNAVAEESAKETGRLWCFLSGWKLGCPPSSSGHLGTLSNMPSDA